MTIMTSKRSDGGETRVPARPAQVAVLAGLTAWASLTQVRADGGEKAAEPATATAAPKRVAFTAGRTTSRLTLKPDLSSKTPTAPAAAEEPVARAIRMITECQTKFQSVSDYTCIFYKRERINGQLTPQFVMSMKERVRPKSIYFKFEEPYRGREAIFVQNRNNGRILAHDVGLTKLLAGTLELEPTCARAMEYNRHPISEAGIGALIETVARRWVSELSPEESVVQFDTEMIIGDRPCMMIESIHPVRQPQFLFHKVRLFIDSELKLPVRFEAYDWPREKGAQAELMEEYSYTNVRLNVGLGDVDFDAANRQYSFGRF